MDYKLAATINWLFALFLTIFCVSVLSFTNEIPYASIFCAVMCMLSAIYCAIVTTWEDK